MLSQVQMNDALMAILCAGHGYYGMLEYSTLTTMLRYYGIVEFSVRDKQCLLLCFSNAKTLSKLQRTFCSVHDTHIEDDRHIMSS